MTSLPRSDALVLFGITGDLAASRLIPALYRLESKGQLDGPVIGVARREWTEDELKAHVRTTIPAADPDARRATDPAVDRLVARLRYVKGDYADPTTFANLAAALGPDRTCPLCYLAVPPDSFPTVIRGLAGAGILAGGRVVVEKPFGTDLVSAQALNRLLHEVLPEDRIFRIDHFLGKEPVQNLLVFRFANGFLEPIWDRYHVERVDITLVEEEGVEGRGSFYDSVGTLRDVVQNHLFQMIALLAMEPPVGPDADSLRDETAKVLRSLRPLDPDDLVRGRYRGYLSEQGVAPGSTTETFVAARLFVDSWRWAGVPWYVRAGKRMEGTVTEAVVHFAAPPRPLFAAAGMRPASNLLRFRVKPDATISLSLQTKAPGEELTAQTVAVDVDPIASSMGPHTDAYERLLGEAIQGDPRLFARQDAVEAAWAALVDALACPPPLEEYDPGTEGPASARELWQPIRAR